MRTTAEYLIRLRDRGCLSVREGRKKWQHAERKWKRRRLDEIQGLVVHQTQGGDDVDALGRYHTGAMYPKYPMHIGDGKGLPGIAYTLFVDKRGEVTLCNDLESITWSHGDKSRPGDENRMFMSVCFGGRFKAEGWDHGDEEPTKAQQDVLCTLWEVTREAFGLTNLDLYGHCDFGKPTCPGDTLKGLVRGYNRLVQHDLDRPESRQQALSDLGFSLGKVDGVWGAKSRHALAQYHRRRRLPVSTWSRLTTANVYRDLQRAARKRPPPPPPASNPPE